MSKYESIGDEIYHIVSKYIEIEGKPYVLEVVSNVTEQMPQGGIDRGQIIETIKKYNHLEGLAHKG